MFNTKAQVDKYVENCLKNVINEAERNLRCFSFAKLYFKVQDYEQARRYVSTYLTYKTKSADALNLLGKVLEKQGKIEAALEAYRESLNIDTKQNTILLKVCELLAQDDVGLDMSRAQYYYEQATIFAPNDPSVFALKERLVSVNSNNPDDVTKLLLAELENRPKDVQLRLRLIRHLLNNNQIKEAYKHMADIEQRSLSIFTIHLGWYETMAEVLTRYQRESMNEASISWDFWILLVSSLDKLATLTLNEHVNINGSGLECIKVVFNFDQSLKVAMQHLEKCNERTLLQEFLSHYNAQLCLHLVTLLFKQAKRDCIRYKEAINMSLPLLFFAYHAEPADLRSLWLDHTKAEYKQQVERWHKEASFRCSQTGHILNYLAKDNKDSILERVARNSSGLWRDKLFKTLFVTREQQAKISSSYFVTDCPNLTVITQRLPSLNDLIGYDEVAQVMYPGSIHNLVWICLNLNLSSFRCTMFNGLPYSTKNLNVCSAESLNILDIEAFIYCVTLTAKQQIEEMKQQVYYNNEKPNVLPLAVSDHVVTSAQIKWFTAAYNVYLKQYGGNMSDLRLNLMRGIEVLRCVGNHGLDVKLLVTLATTFAERAKNLKKESEVEFNEARAELYWKNALPMLEKMQKNQALGVCKNRLFDYKSKEMGLNEIVRYIDEGKLFIATQLMKRKDYERAISILESLRSPYASFYQAEIYKTMANERTNQNKENVTSEMRSQNIILLTRAKDFFYLTLDRLRDPTVSDKHPLNQKLDSEIEKIEQMLCRIDPDSSDHRNECNGASVDNASSDGSLADNVNLFSSTILGNGFSMTSNYENRTPNINRHQWERRESRPSPERLDAQFRQMRASYDATFAQILEQTRNVAETLRTTVEEMKSCYGSVNDGLKSVVDELQNFRGDMGDVIKQLMKENSELKKAKQQQSQPTLTEEELYALEEECGADYGLASNFPSNLYPNLPQPRIPAPGVLPFGHPSMYQNLYPNLYYPNLGVNQANALPYGYQDPQVQDFRALSQCLPTGHSWDAGLLQSGLNQFGRTGAPLHVVPPQLAPTTTEPQYPCPLVIPTPSKPSAPVNVVITNSDPLPRISSVQTTQVFSVTIPPQHLQGGTTTTASSKSQPHNYQIPLPPNSANRLTLAATPSIIGQPPLVVSTQELLSNISPPKYSSIDTTKSPSNKSVGLGLQIEKSLSQCFNTSGLSDVSSVDEHDPCPDFKPIVPLPDEVPVNTGEENENVLFSVRAKLFRFVDKEWKERGVGNLKILSNPLTGKTRVLMRRDQIHKICANHFLTTDIQLTRMPNNPKAYSWAAHDFSDESVVVEKFCARFKTEEEAESFRAAFEKAKESAPDASSAKTAQPIATLGGFKFSGTPTFKPKEDSPVKVVTPKETVSASPFATFSFDTPKTTSKAFGETTKGNNVFAFSTTSNIFSTPPGQPTPHFAFNTSSGTTSIFSTPITSAEVKATTITTPKVDGSPTAPEEYEPNVEFKPVIPLPELVEVKTGEENAEVLFESRAKLLRFDSNTREWKERGIGVMKILKEDNTIRLLMRREQVLKICCNHRLDKNIQFSKMKNSLNALTWWAQDFSEGVLVPETFAIKFKTEELANSFHKAVLDAQASLDHDNKTSATLQTVENVKKDKKVKSTPTEKDQIKSDHSKIEKLKGKLGSWECKNCYIVNNPKSSLCEACGTQKVVTVISGGGANQDAVISTCNKSVFSFDKNSGITITPIARQDAPTVSWGAAFKPKQGSWNCDTCMLSNGPEKVYCVACENPKDKSIPKKDAGGINLSTTGSNKFSFGVASSTATQFGVPSTTSTLFGASSTTSTLFGASSTTSTLFGAPSTTSTLFGSPSTTSTLFGTSSTTTNKLSFPNTATNQFGVQPSTTPQQGFNFGGLAADNFKPKVGSWECSQCLVRNDAEKTQCISCSYLKEGASTLSKISEPKQLIVKTKPPPDSVAITKSSSSVTVTATTNSWGEGFKPKVGSWECSQCFVRNDVDKLYCVACENPKDSTVPKKKTNEGVNLETTQKFAFGIPKKTTEEDMPLNYAVANTGINTSTNIKSPFTLPTMSTFSFSAPQISDKETKPWFGNLDAKKTGKEDGEPAFVFGSPQKHDFEFVPRSPRSHPSGTKDEDDSELYPEEEEDQIYFKPIVPLPDKVEVKTGEEDESQLYCQRAKLFRFVDGEWKERGIGDIKILKAVDDNKKLRVVMRRERILKICLNHYLTADIEYSPKDDKTWLFTAMDYSEGEYNNWLFCVRFKTQAIALEFKKAIDDALINSASGDASPKKKAELVEDDDSDENAVEFVSETQVTPEEEQEALRLKLLPKFMSYRQLPDCKCATCKEDDKILEELLKPVSTQPTGIFFGTPCKPSSLNSTSSFVFGKPFGNFQQSPKPAPPAASLLKGILAKPSLLSNYTPTPPEVFETLNTSKKFSTPEKNASVLLAPDTKSTSSFVTPSTDNSSSVFLTPDIKSPIVSEAKKFSTPDMNVSVILAPDTKNTSSFVTSNAHNSSPVISTPDMKSASASFGSSETKSTTGNFTSSASNVFMQKPKSSLFTPSLTAQNIFQKPESTVTTGNIFLTPTNKDKDIHKTGDLFGNFTSNIFGQSSAVSTTPGATATTLFGGTVPHVSGNLFATTTPIAHSKQGSIFGGNSAASSFEASSTLASLAAKHESEPKAEIVFKCDTDVTFASLAATNPEKPAFGGAGDDKKPFSFLGAGAPVFARQTKSEKPRQETEEGETAVEEEVVEEHDPHFEPIVPLPDAIVVTTGEEDEVAVFNERAKLYRFDADNKEWKERGVGQLKILHHPVNGTFRLILRREQVHKVVLNMLIIPTIDLQPMATSDKAWLWGGLNHSEEEASVEKLAARFKNCDLAKQFHTAVQLAVEKVRQQQESKNVPATVEDYVSRGHEEKVEDDLDGEDDVDDVGEEEEDDDDRSVLFCKSGILYEQVNDSWEAVGEGIVQIYYDPDIYACRTVVNDHDGSIFSNTLIAINTEMTLQGSECIWKAVEWAQNDPNWRTLKVSFDDVDSAQEFHVTFLESVQYATEADIVDGIVTANYSESED